MRVKMEHPDLGPDRQQWVTGEQFDVVWSKEGWVEVERQYETGEPEYVAPTTEIQAPLPNSWELHEEAESESSSKGKKASEK